MQQTRQSENPGQSPGWPDPGVTARVTNRRAVAETRQAFQKKTPAGAGVESAAVRVPYWTVPRRLTPEYPE